MHLLFLYVVILGVLAVGWSVLAMASYADSDLEERALAEAWRGGQASVLDCPVCREHAHG